MSKHNQSQISAIKKELEQLRISIRISLQRERVALIDLAVISLSIIITIAPAMFNFWRLLIGLSGQYFA